MPEEGRSDADVGVLVADLSGFAALTDALGDEAAADLATRFVRVVRRALPRASRIVKTMGDAVLVVARSAAVAVLAAERLRDDVALDPALPPVHVGVAAGPVVWRGRDVFGATVNTASRLAEQAGPGEIRFDGVARPQAHAPSLEPLPRRPANAGSSQARTRDAEVPPC
jgi:adenylate cyclase